MSVRLLDPFRQARKEKLTGLAQITSIAKSINSFVLGNGVVQSLELQIESARQLAEVLAKAREERVFVFRGKPELRPQKLAARFSKNRSEPLQAIFLNFDKLEKIAEHVKGDQVISVETGISLKELNRHLSNHGQWLPVEYLSENVTLADVLDSGDGGFLEAFSSSMRHLVLGMELAITDGEVIKTGGKIVKNVTGYDLSKLFTGSHCHLAVPYLVHLRLFSRPEKEAAFVVSANKAEQLIALANSLRGTGLPAYCIEAIDARLLQLCAQKVTKDTVLASEIGSLLHAAGSTEAILLVGTRGHKEVAEQVIKALKRAVEKTGLRVNEIPAALANRMQRLCSEIFLLSELEYAELSLAPSAMTYFFQTFFQQHGKPFWCARLSSGRLRIASDSRTVEGVVESIYQFSTLINEDGQQPLMVAYPTNDTELTVRQLATEPQSQAALNDVINRLKGKYDPSAILNPLVSFSP